ncbi:MAG: hypothetical protein KGH64_03910 [Candidatus Micrarchaeota archaeon]|nr:hypothetical protein [Candidatus Micrarchaeota archaeon]MDE1859074.1 hypothetical protein [Candidatus Micrarchaeota archaeon]
MELNEASLIESEVTIRNLRLPTEVLETRRAAIRWLALSLGIINPGESRMSSLAVLDALVQFQFVKNADPTVKDMTDYINANWEQINEKTLRYHLLRMKKMGYVDNSGGKFYFKPPGTGDRFDPSNWASKTFETNYGEIAGKVSQVLKDVKSKAAGV